MGPPLSTGLRRPQPRPFAPRVAADPRGGSARGRGPDAPAATTPRIRPQELDDLAAVVFPEEPPERARRAVSDVVAAGHRVSRASGGAVLSARYHLFASGVEGAFACLGLAGPHVHLSRHETCPDCGSPVFEIAACKRCGQVHLPGRTTRQNGGETFRSQSRREMGNKTHWLVLGEFANPLDEDDEAHLEEVDTSNPLAGVCCVGCGALMDSTARACHACRPATPCARSSTGRSEELTRCGGCGGPSPRTPGLQRLRCHRRRARILPHEHLPPDPSVTLPGDGRRLLLSATPVSRRYSRA